MEFYLHLFELFCRAGHTVYSVFNGTKILCAGLVSANLIFISICRYSCLLAPVIGICKFNSTRAEFLYPLLLQLNLS